MFVFGLVLASQSSVTTSLTAQWAHLERNLWLTQWEEEKRVQQRDKIGGEMCSRNTQINVTRSYNTQYTVQNGTNTSGHFTQRRERERERERRRLRTTFRVRRERVTCESRIPTTAHKPYPGPPNTDLSVPLLRCTMSLLT